MQRRQLFRLALGASALAARSALAEDWIGFRGGSHSAISRDTKVPTSWSETSNLRWSVRLPGPGASCPIVVGSRVFVTCYSGYGVTGNGEERPEDLKRHLLCLSRTEGKVLWSRAIPAVLPEDTYRGYLTEHGYASSTPVSDGQRVYVFFGKTGALAFDLEGSQLWHTPVGNGSSNRQWGSGASPVLYRDRVLVNAADESRSLRALDGKTGKEVWRAEANGFELAYGTPILVPGEGGRADLVLGVPGEVWGFDPETGKLSWYATIPMGGNICPTVTAAEGVVYVTGGFPTGGCIAIRAGGKGDVTKTHVLWTSRYTSYVPTPLHHAGHLYWVNEQGVAHCLNAKTGEAVYQERVSAGEGEARPRFYASPVLICDKLYAVSRNAGTFVLAAQPRFQQIAVNRFASDPSYFNATPAVSDGQLFLRSNRFLYCVQAS